MASPSASSHLGPCPCGTGHPYQNCCGRWHQGPQALQAPDAEQLMRSRYTAYVLGLTDYLLHTWHVSTRPSAIEALEPGLRWLGLAVRRHIATGENTAEVEFVAISKWGGRAHRLHEVSRFVREEGRWAYVDGQVS